MPKQKYTYDEKRGAWTTLVWDGTYKENGEKHRKRLSSKKSSRDLELMVAEFTASVENKSLIEYSDQSFYDYALQWVDFAKAAKEENTKKMYRQVVATYFSGLSQIRVGDVRHSHFQQLINENVDHPRTCQIIALTFRQVVRAAARDRLISKADIEDILEDVSLPRHEKKEKRPLSPVEKKAVLSADFDERKGAFVYILYYCGLRKSEALALTGECFDWEKKIVRIRRAVIFVKGKSVLKDYPKSHNGIRSVPLPDALIDRIRPFVETSEGLLFQNVSGGPMSHSGYDRMWDSILTALNIAAGYKPNAKKGRSPRPITDLTAHVFRHNYCTQLCYQVPLVTTKYIARILGDDEAMVLKVYSHISEDREDVARAVNVAFPE